MFRSTRGTRGDRTVYGEGGDGGDEAELRGDEGHAVVGEGEGVQQREAAERHRQGLQLVVVHAQLHLPPSPPAAVTHGHQPELPYPFPRGGRS
jgi:hypothetical protein